MNLFDDISNKQQYDASPMNMSDKEIEDRYHVVLSECLQKVHTFQLPDFLKEDNVLTFGDLYNTLDAVYIMPEKKGTSYEGCTDTLGCYKRENGRTVVCLFLDTMNESLKDSAFYRLEDIVMFTYIHELYHAYFDIYHGESDKNDQIQQVSQYVEETIVERLSMLTMQYDDDLFNRAKNTVSNKFTILGIRQYGLGAADISDEVCAKFKYLKYCMDTGKDSAFGRYKEAIEDTTKSKDDCLCLFNEIFGE